MESNAYNIVLKKSTEINSESEIIRGDQQFSDFLKLPIATYRRHAHQIPHRKVGNVRMVTKSVLIAWLEGRLEWPPASEKEKQSTPHQSVPRVSRKGGAK